MGDLKSVSENKDVLSPDDDVCVDQVEEGCGVKGCRPRVLQRLATLPAFTAVYALSSLLALCLTVYVNSQVTTLEKQFGFSSSETGIILAANDIGFLSSTLFVGYFATKVHIPRWMSMTMIVYGISGLICSIPHFLFGIDSTIISNNDTTTFGKQIPSGQLCTNTNQSRCLSDDVSSDVTPSYGISGYDAKISLGIIVIGMVLQGFAKGPRHPFVVVYLDNNTDKTKLGFILGIIIATAIFGPSIAFILGGYFTQIYVTLEDVEISPRHPRWIGAWWLGFIVFGVAAILMGLPLFFFPKYLHGRRLVLEKKTSIKTESTSWQTWIISNAKNFCFLFVKIITNPIYVMLQVSSCVGMFGVAGSRAFLPKYVETQYNVPAWKANLILAGLGMTTAAIGTFIGGWITKRFKFTPLGNLKYLIIIDIIAVALKSLAFVFGCDQQAIHNMPGSVSNMDTSCYSNCFCDDEDYFPICSEDFKNFYSPCHAGCPVSDGNTYNNCTCITSGRATAGLCPTSCTFLYPYAVLMGVLTLLGTTTIMPKLTTIIRCVPEIQKALATSLHSFLTSLFGWLLGPVIYGKVIDSICLIWDKRCDGRGSCSLYDLSDFRYKFHGFIIGIDVISMFSLVLVVVIARNYPHMNRLPGTESSTINVDTKHTQTGSEMGNGENQDGGQEMKTLT